MQSDRFFLTESGKYSLTRCLRWILLNCPHAPVTVAYDIVIDIKPDGARGNHSDKVLHVSFGQLDIDLLVFLSAIIRTVGEVSPTVNVIDGILAHMPEVSRYKSLDIVLVCSPTFEALIVDLFLNAIEYGESLFLAFSCKAIGEHKLSGSRHLQLDVIEVFDIFSE